MFFVMFLFCLFFFLFFLGSSDSEDKKKEKENARPADRSTQVRSREERDDGGGGGGGDGGGKKRTRGKTIDWRKGVELKALLTVQSSGYSRRPRRHLGASSRLLLPPWLRSIYLSLSLSLKIYQSVKKGKSGKKLYLQYLIDLKGENQGIMYS